MVNGNAAIKRGSGGLSWMKEGLKFKTVGRSVSGAIPEPIGV
jgi:hypothetical protein